MMLKHFSEGLIGSGVESTMQRIMSVLQEAILFQTGFLVVGRGLKRSKHFSVRHGPERCMEPALLTTTYIARVCVLVFRHLGRSRASLSTDRRCSAILTVFGMKLFCTSSFGA
ncbi:hypothetical protein MRX96_026838 [Rhipicephalus microplus]